MFTKTGKLLITNIKNSDLYDFAVQFITKVGESFENNPTIAPYYTTAMKTIEEMEKVISRNLKNPLTVQVINKNKERAYFLAALRRKIGVSQMMLSNPARIEAANRIKQEMKDRGWWKYTKLSYADTSTIIRTMLKIMAEEPFSRWVSTAKLQPMLNRLGKSQAKFQVLLNERIEEKSNDTTLQMTTARKKLSEVLLALITVIDFGVENDPETYAEIGEFAIDMITEFNAKTLTRQTLAANSEEEPVGDDTVSEGETGVEAEETVPETEETVEDGTLEGGLADA